MSGATASLAQSPPVSCALPASDQLWRHGYMLVIVLGLILIVAAFVVRWRALTPIERCWAILICTDALGIFLVPTTPARTPQRLLADRAMEVAVAVCILLMLVGVALVRTRWRAGRRARDLVPVFVVGGIPLVVIGLISLMWSVLT
jgi:hypothetical protein